MVFGVYYPDFPASSTKFAETIGIIYINENVEFNAYDIIHVIYYELLDNIV